MHRALPLYQQVFGFAVAGESHTAGRQFVFLARDGELVLTLWQQSDGHFNPHQPGLHHLSFQVGSIDEVRALEARLRTLNTPFLYDTIVPHGEGAASGGVFFEDPDGIRLEIYSPTGAQDYTAPVADGPSCGFF